MYESVPELMCAAAITPPLKEACNEDVKCPGTKMNIFYKLILELFD